MIRNTIAFGILLLILIQVSCATSDKVVRAGDTFEVALEQEGEGGFEWTYKPTEGIIAIDTFKTNIELPSGFSEYTKHFKFRGEKKGKYALEFVKIRSFQPELILDGNVKEIVVRIKKSKK